LIDLPPIGLTGFIGGNFRSDRTCGE